MRVSSFLMLTTLGVSATTFAADEIIDPDPGQLNPAEIVEQMPSMPDRGSTKASVRERLGEPNRKVPAVGEPPISRWVYDAFTVYFEHDRVLHSVKNDDDRP